MASPVHGIPSNVPITNTVHSEMSQPMVSVGASHFTMGAGLEPKREPVRINAMAFVEKGPTALIRWGTPLFSSSVRLSHIEDGEYQVSAHGEETPNATWNPMPEDPERICSLTARGVAFVGTLDPVCVIENLNSILSDPERHPEFLAGVEASENLEELPLRGAERTRFINWQRSDTLQYLSEIRIFQVANGFVHVQTTLHDSETLNRYQYAFRQSTLPVDEIQFWGNVQVLEVVDGVAIVIEMRANASNISVPCGMAADSGVLNALSSLGITDDPRKAVKQRIEDRLKVLSELAKQSLSAHP